MGATVHRIGRLCKLAALRAAAIVARSLDSTA
jgi:hypothetical protein